MITMSPRPATATAGKAFVPIDPDYEARVRASFGRQGAMRLIGARLSALRPRYCAIELPFRDDLTQQHGYVHAGIIGAIVDSAGGYAGFTLFPADASVLTVEYKLNLPPPAAGEPLVAVAELVMSRRTRVLAPFHTYAATRCG